MERRSFLQVAALAATTVAGSNGPAIARQRETPPAPGKKSRIRHSVCRWCFGKIAIDDLCREVAAMGGSAIDLLDEPDWGTPGKHGLVCSVANGPGGIEKGWNRVEHHDVLLEKTVALLPKVAAAKVPNSIVFSGNRAGLTDAEGAKNCIAGLKSAAKLAEQYGVTLLFEILNSKVDHQDYQFDRMAYGLEVVKAVGSPRLKILYDIYHAQIMEGDVIRTIRENIQWIGHFHTGGVPGRNEIDATQELNYGAICKAIADTGYQGFVAQEFVPKRKDDPLASLREAFAICDA
jgi:hydroxypyruvate isomerase